MMKAKGRGELMRIASRFIFLAILLAIPSIIFATAPAGGAPAPLTPAELLARAALRPAPAGHERVFMDWLRRQLPGPAPLEDNLHNLIYRFGAATPASGAAPLLIVAELDQPDYLISRILPDGNLRLQAMRSGAPPTPGYSRFFFAAPLEILRPNLARRGEDNAGWSPLAAAGYGPSIHLMTLAAFRRLDSRLHLDQVYVTTGAATRAAVMRAGVRLLQPVIVRPQLFAAANSPYWFGTMLSSRVMAPVAARLLAALGAQAPSRPVDVALATQGWFGHAGLRRLVQELSPAQVIVLGTARSDTFTAASNDPQLGRVWGEHTAMPVDMALSAQTDHGVARALGKTPSLVLGFPIRYAHTAAEMADLNALRLFSHSLTSFVLQQAGVPGRRIGGVVALPGRSATGWVLSRAVMAPAKTPPIAMPSRRQITPSPAVVSPLLEHVVQVAAASQHEAPMRQEVRRLIARIAPRLRVHRGPAGTLWTQLGPSRGPALLFIAHMDEIGWNVNGMLPDGELALTPLGGFLPQLYSGRILLVHTATGVIPGTLHYLPTREGHRPLARLDVGLSGPALQASGIQLNDFVTVPKRYQTLLEQRVTGRSLDDRVGDAAELAAIRELAAAPPRRRVIIAFSTGEELGLDGARALAQLWKNDEPEAVFALDTFVSSDSPIETHRFAHARLGDGFVIRAADNSLIAPFAMTRRILRLARAARIPVQYGVTGGGNDASAFIPYGSAAIGLGWPMASSHSPAELSDLRDVAALARIVVTISRDWTPAR